MGVKFTATNKKQKKGKIHDTVHNNTTTLHYSTFIFTASFSSALGIFRVKIPSPSFASTPFASPGRGSQMVRVNLELPVKDRSTAS